MVTIGDYSGFEYFPKYDIAEIDLPRIPRTPPFVQQWHVITKRPAAEGEQSEYMGFDPQSDEGIIYGNLPVNKQKVLVCDQSGEVYVDVFYCDFLGCYFENGLTMNGIVAWMELPKPYKEEK